MVTLRRFRAMVDSYGADSRHWPEAVRDEALTLLGVSAQARAILNEARTLDAAIAAASAHETARLWQPGEQDAALARLQSGVAVRIAATSEGRPAKRPFGWLLPQLGFGASSLSLRWAGMATASGFVITAGLLLGAMYTATPAPDTVLTLLQPETIHLLAD